MAGIVLDIDRPRSWVAVIVAPEWCLPAVLRHRPEGSGRIVELAVTTADQGKQTAVVREIVIELVAQRRERETAIAAGRALSELAAELVRQPLREESQGKLAHVISCKSGEQ